MPIYVFEQEKRREQFGIYETAISALNVNANGTFPTRCLWSMPRCDVDVVAFGSMCRRRKGRQRQEQERKTLPVGLVQGCGV